MSFSLSNCKFLRGLFVGVIFLTAGCTLHAADLRGQPIQIVPSKGDTIGTNVNQLRTAEPEKFETDFSISKLKTPFNPGSSLDGMMAPPFPPPTSRRVVPNQREKEMMDRRRNWAFATPEDSGLTAEEMFHLKEFAPDTEDKPPTTAMQRYLERLNNHGSTTNHFGKRDFSASWNETNSLASDSGNENDRSLLSPFSATPEASVFKAAALPNTFSDIFGFNKNKSEEETLRAQQTYQSHMESFKQVWDFQPPTAPSVQTPVAGSFSSGSAFSSPTRTFQSVAGAMNSSASASPASSSLTPVQPTPEPMRIGPPKPDYSIPQRRF